MYNFSIIDLNFILPVIETVKNKSFFRNYKEYSIINAFIKHHYLIFKIYIYMYLCSYLLCYISHKTFIIISCKLKIKSISKKRRFYVLL